MQANKDEAVKCLNIARRALREGNADKARRFCDKAKRLGGDTLADQVALVIREIEAASKASKGGDGATTSGTSSAKGAADDLRRRSKRSAGSSSSSADSGTPEQRALVKRINGCKDYYQILGIDDKTCSDDQIKRAYKKLALKLHPDKCRCNGAEDAFKAVSRAFSCLSDTQKRRTYDRYGSEDAGGFGGMGGGGGGGGGFYRTHHAQEIDPEELFNMFFGGSPVFGNMYTRGPSSRQRRANASAHARGSSSDQGGGGFNLAAIIQLLPVVFLVVFTLFGNSPQDPVYSLDMVGKYNARETTSMKGIDFYVKSHGAFSREYPKGTYARRRVDVAVERDYRQYLENECWRERIRKNSSGRSSVKMKSCTKLQEIWG